MLGPDFSIFLERYDAVYIDIAKVASSSLKATFASLLDLDLDAVDGNPHEVEFPRPPYSAYTEERLYPGLYTFAFVRNPWDRLVSCYRDKIGGELDDFTNFSESGVAHCLAHFRSQHDYLTNLSGDIAVDFVGRYENLVSDFQHLAHEIGLPSNTKLHRLQAAPKVVDYADYYTPDTRNVVATRFAQDIELFSYQFD